MATARPRVLYLDSSAIVKLVVREAESDALQVHVDGWQLITSEVALTEVPRAAYSKTRDVHVIERAETMLRRFDLVRLDDELHHDAARSRPADLRTLEAIHLVSALRLGGRVDEMVVYERRLSAAARAAGLSVSAPGIAR